MFRATAMKRAQLLVLERDVRSVTFELGRIGILHITSSKDTEGLAVPSAQKTQDALARCDAALARVRAAAATLGVEEARAGRTGALSLEDVDAFLARVEPRLGEIEGKADRLRRESAEKSDLVGEIRRYETLTVPFSHFAQAGFLHFAVGSVPVRELPAVIEETGARAVLVPFGVEEGRQHVIAVSSRKGKWTLQGVLEKHDFQSESLEGKTVLAPVALIEQAHSQLADLDRKLAQVEEEKRLLREEEGRTLSELLGKLELERKILSAQTDFAHTWSAVLITGWVPEARLEELIDAVASVTGNRVLIEFRDPSELPDETVPTLLSHRGFFRPFEMFVTAFGVPGYLEAEPTILVAVSFLLMFGFMFGDVGQGGVLILSGLALVGLGRTRPVKDIGVIVASAGGGGHRVRLTIRQRLRLRCPDPSPLDEPLAQNGERRQRRRLVRLLRHHHPHRLRAH
ncbi:MAG: V-type ATPase 116kDa subunit family protein [Planctomycetota bacterium]